MSVFSYPDRGPWGKSGWRGNCSGHFYKDLFGAVAPKLFVDPMVGSGTSVEVAKEMGIEAVGLDLHMGFNALRDSIVDRVGREADLVFSHPPYGDIIVYSGSVWGAGSEGHADDLSRCESDEDFHEKMHAVMLNQREATLPGGYYGCLIGDKRRQGKYVSYQAEQIARMPADELAAVWIKQQHNCLSDRRTYAAIKMPFIAHEYCVLWKKPAVIQSCLQLLNVMARQCDRRMKSTWKAMVRSALAELQKGSGLPELYEYVAKNAPEKLSQNPNWREKIRQTLSTNKDLFRSEGRGQWRLAA